jgi:DNA ligase (NAD+)
MADLNQNPRLIDTMSQEALKKIIEESDIKYDQGQSFLLDNVYDYAKRIYNQRKLQTTDKTQILKSLSSPSGVGIVRQRDSKLPVALRSLDNMFYGEGDVEKWKNDRCDHYVSAKMDGISGLYFKGELFTRGDALKGRNISHILPYLKTKLPDVPFYVRGELIINRHVFQAKFQGQKGRGNARNSVSGAVGAIHKIDTDFLSELEFIAYEIIPLNEIMPLNLSPGKQFANLEQAGFKTAIGKNFTEINDNLLSDYYTGLLSTYEYEIDGLVVARDETYERESTKNPVYARAFKKALECLLAPSEVTSIEWNVSSYGYLIPTVLYKPVQICGVTLARATGESARYIIENGLGPGAKVEIIYHGKVNPRIHQVFQKVEPALPPEEEWTWIPRETGDPIHIKACSEKNVDEIQIQGLIRFINDLKVKNVGPGLVTQLYKAGFNTMEKILKMRPEDIRFLGPKTSESIPEGIRIALATAKPEMLMVCSGAFGRGIGEKKISRLLKHYPDFLSKDYTQEEIQAVEGFAGKTATLIVQGLPQFQKFVRQNSVKIKETANSNSKQHSTTNLKICLTGFRDADIQNFIESNGGSIQTSCTKSTDILIIPNSEYTNKKTETAKDSNVKIMTREAFKTQYLI